MWKSILYDENHAELSELFFYCGEFILANNNWLSAVLSLLGFDILFANFVSNYRQYKKLFFECLY